MKRRATCLLVILSIVVFSATTVFADMSFQGLGDLPGGSFYSRAYGVSADGSAVAGSSRKGPDDEKEAFRWTLATGMVGLGDLPGNSFASEASGISADGSVVVGKSRSASGVEAFRWTSGGGMVGLGDLEGGRFFSAAIGASADGSVVVGAGNVPLIRRRLRRLPGLGGRVRRRGRVEGRRLRS